MKNKFLIFTKPYNDNVGGLIVMHKLCHILNELGHECFLVPYFPTYEINRLRFKYYLRCFFWGELSRLVNFSNKYKLNEKFNTPIFRGNLAKEIDDFIVIYPEVVFGNPLNSKKIVRWFLHQPGFHSKKIYYGFNEIYFKFNSAIDDFSFKGSVSSEHELKIIHYPLDIYNLIGVNQVRSGVAYTVKKGTIKDIPFNLKEAILIDGLSHKEVANIFKRVSTFISFDSYTAYSLFATLCGCDSIVVPENNVSKEEWYPNKEDRYGLAYGFSTEELEHARATKKMVKQHVDKEEKKNINNVNNFVEEVTAFFGVKK